jgi:hypothetical protein
MFHPVTTEQVKWNNIQMICKWFTSHDHNYIVVYPNNDLGVIYYFGLRTTEKQ